MSKIWFDESLDQYVVEGPHGTYWADTPAQAKALLEEAERISLDHMEHDIVASLWGPEYIKDKGCPVCGSHDPNHNVLNCIEVDTLEYQEFKADEAAFRAEFGGTFSSMGNPDEFGFSWEEGE